MTHTNYPRKISGFTIIELLVVLAIISILMAIFIFRYQDYTQIVLVNRQANEIALTLREAQFFATGVKELQPGTDEFVGWYSVHFHASEYFLRALEEASYTPSSYINLSIYSISGTMDQFHYELAGDTVPEEKSGTTVFFRKGKLAPVIRTDAGEEAYRLELVVYSPNGLVERRICVEQTGRMFISKESSCLNQ